MGADQKTDCQNQKAKPLNHKGHEGTQRRRSRRRWRKGQPIIAWDQGCKSFRSWDDRGRVAPGSGRYKPGTYLTDWTGDIPDTATMASLSLKRADAMENEQCDGREAAVCI